MQTGSQSIGHGGPQSLAHPPAPEGRFNRLDTEACRVWRTLLHLKEGPWVEFDSTHYRFCSSSPQPSMFSSISFFLLLSLALAAQTPNRPPTQAVPQAPGRETRPLPPFLAFSQLLDFDDEEENSNAHVVVNLLERFNNEGSSSRDDETS